MKRILIVAPFTILPGEKGFNRFRYLAERLVNEGYEVELLTSNFLHNEKIFRKEKDICNFNTVNQLRITLINEKGYRRNVGFGRIVSHKKFSKNLKSYLKNKKSSYDIVYCAYPLIESSEVVIKYCDQEEIPFVLDIQDIWPESINTILKLPHFLLSILLLPITFKANRIYRASVNIVAVSHTYLNRALRANSNVENRLVIPIGTDINVFDKLSLEKVNKTENEFWVTYIGTLSYSYDIETLIQAIKVIKNKGYSNIKLLICGSGPKEQELKEMASEISDGVNFLGHLTYQDMVPILYNSNVAANALTKSSLGSLTNKLGDYLAAGLPILNSGSNIEVLDLIEKESLGINYESGDFNSLADHIIYLYLNLEIREKHGLNSRRVAEKNFKREKTYNEITTLIKSII